MKIQNLILLMVGSIVLTGGAIAFGYYLSQANVENDDASSETSQVSDLSSSNGSSLRVLGSDDEPTNNLPQPDEFSIYEEYVTAEAAMYQDITEGNGREIAAGDNVAVLYQGWLTNGQLFDQTRTNEAGQLEPFVFQLGAGQVISGWEQGIAGMKIGGKRRLIIPPSVGYGESGQGSIPPNSVLVFDVEVLDAQSPQQPGL